MPYIVHLYCYIIVIVMLHACIPIMFLTSKFRSPVLYLLQVLSLLPNALLQRRGLRLQLPQPHHGPVRGRPRRLGAVRQAFGLGVTPGAELQEGELLLLGLVVNVLHDVLQGIEIDLYG